MLYMIGNNSSVVPEFQIYGHCQVDHFDAIATSSSLLSIWIKLGFFSIGNATKIYQIDGVTVTEVHRSVVDFTVHITSQLVYEYDRFVWV